MSLTLTCRACGITLTAETEEELVAAGADHHDREHADQEGNHRAPTREHIIARIRRHNR